MRKLILTFTLALFVTATVVPEVEAAAKTAVRAAKPPAKATVAKRSTTPKKVKKKKKTRRRRSGQRLTSGLVIRP